MNLQTSVRLTEDSTQFSPPPPVPQGFPGWLTACFRGGWPDGGAACQSGGCLQDIKLKSVFSDSRHLHVQDCYLFFSWRLTCLRSHKAAVPGMTWRAPFSLCESSKASHTDRTGPPAIPQYLWTAQLQSVKKNWTKMLLISNVIFSLLVTHVHLISWCQATYGSPSSPSGLVTSSCLLSFMSAGLTAGYLQMKRESSRMTSGPRTALITCRTRGCLVRFITHGYLRWTLCRLYWVYSSPVKTHNTVSAFLFYYSVYNAVENKYMPNLTHYCKEVLKAS